MATSPHSERKHARISPSGLKYLAICPGFTQQQSDEVHPVTAEGTLLHEALDEMKFDHLTPEQMELCQYCLDYFEEHKDDGKVMREPRLEVFGGVFGFADVVTLASDFKTASVFDWKMGWTKVDHSSINYQGRAYALGVFNIDERIESVTVHFVQPRLGYTPSHTFTREDVKGIAMEIRAILALAAKQDPETYRVEPSVCQYCSRVECPKVASLAHKLATSLGKGRREAAEALGVDNAHEVSKTSEWIIKQAHKLPESFDPSTCSDPELMSHCYAIAPMVEKWASAVRARALELWIEEGQAIPGYELRFKKTARRVLSPRAVYELAKKYVPEDALGECLTVQLSNVEKVLKEYAPKRKGAETVRQFNDELREIFAVEDGREVPYLKAEVQSDDDADC